jgi:hypothetical protein
MNAPNPAAVSRPRPSKLFDSTSKATAVSVGSVSTVGTVLTDLLGVQGWPLAPWACSLGWVVAVLALLVSLGIPQEQNTEERWRDYPQYLQDGWKHALRHKGWLLAVLLFTAGAAYSLYLKSNQGGGVLHDIAVRLDFIESEVSATRAAAEKTQAVAVETQAAVVDAKAVVDETKAAVLETKAAVDDTKAVVMDTNAKTSDILDKLTTKTPRQVLAEEGVSFTDDGYLDALASGNLNALRAFNELQYQRTPLEPDDPWDPLRRLIDSRNADVGQALQVASLSAQELNLPLMLSEGSEKLPPRRNALLSAHGFQQDAYVNLEGVTPLLYAVWRNRLSAVQALLAQGADPNQRAQAQAEWFEASRGLRKKIIPLTPLSEAQRLGHQDVEQLLLEAGAKR